MPDSYGKRKRRDVKAKKAAAREERRVARTRRREAREAGLIPAGTPIEASDPFGGLPPEPAPAPEEEKEEAAAPGSEE